MAEQSGDKMLEKANDKKEFKTTLASKSKEKEEGSAGSSNVLKENFKKRKKNDNRDFNDRGNEQNLLVKIEKKRMKYMKRMEAEESEEKEQEIDEHREAITNELYSNDLESNEKDERDDADKVKTEQYDEESDADFIVDVDNKPIRFGGKKIKRDIFAELSLQELQDIFGVDFHCDEFEKNGDDYQKEVEEEEDGYIDKKREGDIDSPKETTKTAEKKTTTKNIFEIFMNSKLNYNYYTDLKEVHLKDIPERMQYRAVPVTSATEKELVEEAKWIYTQAFKPETISMQDFHVEKDLKTVAKIRNTLIFIRNRHFEVPFISFYRKEYIFPELTNNDLWKIYKFDAKWCQLQKWKEALLIHFQKIKRSQDDQIIQDPNMTFPNNMRLIEEKDLKELKNVQTIEELVDHLKQIVRLCSRHYSIYCKAGLDSLVKKFIFSPKHCDESLSKGYQIYEIEEEIAKPSVVAAEYIGEMFQTVDDVLKAAQLLAAIQLAKEPSLRKSVRKMYRKEAKISVRPTEKGVEIINENHPLYIMKYLKNKPVKSLVGDQYLKLVMGQKENLIKILFSHEINYIQQLKKLYYRFQTSENDKNWKALQVGSTKMAISELIIPDLKKELHLLLLNEAKDCVMRACALQMHNWIKITPYKLVIEKEDEELAENVEDEEEFNDDEYDEDWDINDGVRVMSIAYVPDSSVAAFACIVAPDGSCTDYLELPHLLKRKSSGRESDWVMKEADMLAIRNFMSKNKPHVVVIGGESIDAPIIAKDIEEAIEDLLFLDENFLDPKVEIIENELAIIYAKSRRGVSEFKNYPELLRQAISLARRLQDPLLEFSQLCNAENEILCLKFHPLQDQLPKEELLENIYLEFVNLVNQVGVDLNKAVQQPHTRNLVQFVCGLGPLKAQYLIETLKQTNQLLENRQQLVTACHMGPKIFINCAGFIKIDTNNFDDNTKTHVNVLDSSRIHPENYTWAEKMVFDALDYEDQDNPAGAMEEIFKSPEKLRNLDLDASAEALEKHGFGIKCITLCDIRFELTSRYKDLRILYRRPSPIKLFYILTKETPLTFYFGKLIEATVEGIIYQEFKRDEVKQINPLCDDVTHLWQCPLCLKLAFRELSEVKNHFDTGDCPGKITSITLRLDNGLSGYIKKKNLTDKRMVNLEEVAFIGKRIRCRIIKININDSFRFEATSKCSDLVDKNQIWRPLRDLYYDLETEAKDNLIGTAKINH